MPHSAGIGASLILAVILCVLPALATPEVPQSALNEALYTHADIPPLKDLDEQADRVIMGEVLTTRTQRDPSNIYTVATVRVWETLRGHQDPIVEVHLPGAMLSNHDLSVFGQAKLLPGFEVLLFLRGEQVVGMGAGAFVLLGNKAWKNKRPGLAADPKTVGRHAASLYVAHDISAVRAALR